MAPRLLAITDRRLTGGDPVPAARALMARGRERVVILLRERDADARTLLTWAAALLDTARTTNSRVLVSDRVDLAACLDGLGVQLPERGLDPRDARRLLGPDRLLGASVHDLAGARAALDRGADLLTLAPVFPTTSKPRTLAGEAPVLGLRGLAELVSALPAPGHGAQIFALGGIDAEATSAVLDTGVDGVAAIRGAWVSPALLSAVLAR